MRNVCLISDTTKGLHKQWLKGRTKGAKCLSTCAKAKWHTILAYKCGLLKGIK